MIQNTVQVGQFFPYLSQDNLEGPDSEEAIAAISESLDGLLRATPSRFWLSIKAEPNIKTCISSYLQSCRRPGDIQQRSGEPSVARQNLSRQIFLLLYRLIVDEPSTGMSRAERGELLYNQWILDVPKLLDVAALYARMNPSLTRQVMQKVFELQPKYFSDLENVVPTLLINIEEVEATCIAASTKPRCAHDDSAVTGLCDGITYLAGEFRTIAAFLSTYPPTAALLLQHFPALAARLTDAHDRLVPAVARVYSDLRLRPTQKEMSMQVLRLVAQLQLACERLLFVTLEQGYLRGKDLGSAETGPSSSSGARGKAEQQGVALLEKLEQLQHGDLLSATQSKFGLGQAIVRSQQEGYLALDSTTQHRVLQLLGCTHLCSPSSSADTSGNDLKVKLKRISDVLPGYGDGFLSACLEAANQDADRVIAQLLDGTLPGHISKLDPQMSLDERKQQQTSLAREEPLLTSHGSTTRPSAGTSRLTSSSHRPSSSQQPASVHKGTAYALQSSQQERALAKFFAQAAELEDDEPDDTNSQEDSDNVPDRFAEMPSGDAYDDGPSSSSAHFKQPPQAHVQAKGGKPLWVLNGRVYNYRKEGATPVPNQAAAQEAMQAAADEIHGLGAGGNKAAAAPPGFKAQGGGSIEALSGFAAPDTAQGGGRGAQGSSRGGRGGGRATSAADNRRMHAFKDAHKADLANHHRKDRALRKRGGF